MFIGGILRQAGRKRKGMGVRYDVRTARERLAAGAREQLNKLHAAIGVRIDLRDAPEMESGIRGLNGKHGPTTERGADREPDRLQSRRHCTRHPAIAPASGWPARATTIIVAVSKIVQREVW